MRARREYRTVSSGQAAQWTAEQILEPQSVPNHKAHKEHKDFSFFFVIFVVFVVRVIFVVFVVQDLRNARPFVARRASRRAEQSQSTHAHGSAPFRSRQRLRA